MREGLAITFFERKRDPRTRMSTSEAAAAAAAIHGQTGPRRDRFDGSTLSGVCASRLVKTERSIFDQR
jgi:hypothetical protein